jgi:hypothetical protein
MVTAFLANVSSAPRTGEQAANTRGRRVAMFAKRLIAAAAIVMTLLGAGHLPEVDDLLERVPTAVRTWSNS